jgi:N-acetylglucosamine-6-phosphate deacetylase
LKSNWLQPMIPLHSTHILNAQLPQRMGYWQLEIDDRGIIQAIQPMAQALAAPTGAVNILDVAGDWISLGGVDLQINGALGLSFPDLNSDNAKQLPAICQFLWEQGVDAFSPTIVTSSIEDLHRSLAILADWQSQAGAQILGVHLEGPFLNLEKRGAHPAQHLRPLTLEQVKLVLDRYAPAVKVITLAPELDPTGTIIPYLRSLGIVVSLGHSLATADQAQHAFTQGATMVTHAFNAMPSLHHREPGLLGAAIADPHVQCGFIADGQHVVPLMLKLLIQASQEEKGLFLVSDALAPLGLSDGTYPWDQRLIEVKQGTARLEDGTLSGTTLSLLVGVQNLVQWEICEIGTAIALATEAPRHAIGLPGLGIGQLATLLRWHWASDAHQLTWQRLVNLKP